MQPANIMGLLVSQRVVDLVKSETGLSPSLLKVIRARFVKGIGSQRFIPLEIETE